MLLIHFTPEDIARVRVAPGPDLLWEISNSVQTLQRTDGERVFGAWRRWVRPRLPESRRLLSPLLPPYGYSPDFLTPTTGEHTTLRAAVDTLLGTPRTRLRAELARLAASARLPGWTRALAAGDAGTLARLGDALHAYQAQVLLPHWRRVRADVEADRARRLQHLMDGGTEGLLAGLGPDIRWRPPVLEVAYPVDQQLFLGGRGLVLQPSFFCWPAPTTLADGQLPPVLVHPIQHTAGWAAAGGPGAAAERDPLGQLLGRTRAELLRAAWTGCSTVEAARMLQVTHPAVSQHMNVLRAAGLISTVRSAGRAFHLATAEGRALLATEQRETAETCGAAGPRGRARPGSADRPHDAAGARSTDGPRHSDERRSADEGGNSDQPRHAEEPRNSDRPRNADQPRHGDKPQNAEEPHSAAGYGAAGRV